MCNCRPSDLIGIDQEETYARYCIDEACTYIYNMMQPDKDGKCKEPRFEEDESVSDNPGLDMILGFG
nr:MAG TPA: hypothetical protein [Caudoviricetes sp.]